MRARVRGALILIVFAGCGEQLPIGEGFWAVILGAGDLNGDGVVNALDLQLEANVFLGSQTDPTIRSRADLNGDGAVNALDVQAIANLILGTNTLLKRMGGLGSEEGNALAVDSAGNIFVGGYAGFEGVDYGCGVVTGGTMVLTKFSALGRCMWMKRFGPPQFGPVLEGLIHVMKMSIDPSGNLLTAGVFYGAASFGGSTFTAVSDSNATTCSYYPDPCVFPDIFLAKYDQDGNHVWSKGMGGSTSDALLGLAVDSGSNVIITGNFSRTVDFGGGLATSTGVASGGFLVKYGPNGVYGWGKTFSNSLNSSGQAVVVDSGNNIIMTGHFANTLNFGGADLSSTSDDIFLVKYTPSGAHTWSVRNGGGDTDIPMVMAVDSAGDVALAGTFYGAPNYGSGVFTARGNSDAFLMKYSTAGAYQWSKQLGGVDWETPWGIATDRDRNIIVTGAFGAAVDFGGGPLTSLGDSDIFVAKYGPTGAHSWSKRFGDISQDAGAAVATDGMSNIFITGLFRVRMTQGSQTIVADGTEYSDGFVMKMFANGTP